jgi:hypothetical protein
VKPETFATCFVAAHDASRRWEPEPLLSPRDLRQERLRIASSDVAHERDLTEHGGAARIEKKTPID